MNSGMRLSAAVIALVVIALGIYYASLDDGESRESTVTYEDDVSSVVEPSAGTDQIAANDSGSSRPPVLEPREPQASDDAEAAATSEATPSPGDLAGVPATDDASTASGSPPEEQPVDASTGMAEPTFAVDDDLIDPNLEPDLEPDLEAALQLGAPADGLGAGTDAEQSSTTGSDAPALDDAIDVDAAEETDSTTVESDLGEGELETPARTVDPSSSLPGRSVDAPGLGGHVVVSADAPADVLNPAAQALGSAEAGLVIIPVDPAHAWLAVPSDLQDNALLDAAVVANRPDSGMQFVLVREDLGGSISLDGRVAAAEAAILPLGDRYRVRYRVDQDHIDSVRRESTVLIGRPVAWVVNGAVVSISRPRISISQRSVLPISVTEDTAMRVADEIMGIRKPTSEVAGEIEEAGATETPAPRGTVDRGGRPARAGELPADAYTIYVVKPSDTPSSIAQEWFGDANKYSLILNANPLVDPKRLMPGDELRLPPKDFELHTIIDHGDGDQPVIHIVQSGENLSGIALAAYGDASLWPRIYEANKDKIKDPSRLDVGTELTIP